MLPDEELKRANDVRGEDVISIRLCAMGGCGEEFDQPASTGFCCLTWGVVLDFASGSLAISCGEDEIGDPMRIALVEPEAFLRMESLVQQDVSALLPWSRYVGSRFDSYETLTYQSNYGRPPSRTTWHSVPWGFLMHMDGRGLLVAAAQRTNPFAGAPCADEIVVAYSDLAIRRLCTVREGERSEWTEG